MLARSAIDQAQRLEPDLPAIHFALASLRATVEHDYPSAQRELELLARSQPDDAETCQLRGSIHRNLGQFSVAIEFCQRGRALDPKNINGFNTLGLALMSASRYAEAESVLNQAAQFDQSSLPLSNRARVLLRWKGDARLAFASVEQVRMDRLTGASFKNVVWLARAAGENAKALEYIRQANWSVTLAQWEYVIRDLLSAQTKEGMGDSEGARRDYLAALPIAERTRDAHPGSWRAYVTLAQVYAGLGRREEALTAVRKSLEILPPAQNQFYTAFLSLRVLADIEARFGLIDEALEIVRQQIAAGLWVRNDLLLSPDFIHLQKDPRFRALAEKAPL
jgi:tetratricopeptide (TPR) repeat protein